MITTAEDYEFVLKSVDVAAEIVIGAKCFSKILIADCAEAISVARQDRVKLIFCFNHIISTVRKRLETIKEIEHQGKLNNRLF